MNIIEVEAKIRAAVADAKAKGWRIRQREYVSIDKRQCCVLAACVLDEIERSAMPSDGRVRHIAANALRISEPDALRIVFTFDGDTPHNNEFEQFGVRLRDLVDP